jgi:hypothetical protein
MGANMRCWRNGVNCPIKGEFVKTLFYLFTICTLPLGMTACGGCQPTPESDTASPKPKNSHVITVSSEGARKKTKDDKDEKIRQLNHRITTLQEKRDLLETRRQVLLSDAQRLQSNPNQVVDAQMKGRQADSIKETIEVIDSRIDGLVSERAVLEGKKPEEEVKEYNRKCEEARKHGGKCSGN